MKAGTGIIQYSSRQDYLNKRGLDPKDMFGKLSDEKKEKLKELASKSKSPDNAHKVDLSDESKEKSQSEGKEENPKKVKNQSKVPPAAKKGLTEAGLHIMKDAAGTLYKGLDTISMRSGIPLPNITARGNGSLMRGPLTAIQAERTQIVNAPGVFVISGFQFGDISSEGDGGIRDMAKYIPGAQHFNWDQEESIFQEIKKRPVNQPIVLIGHSFGGDAAVNLANKLNSMENGFREVDLLVTLDSVGFNNDFIPPNVKENLNFIGDKDMLFNDGPNVARNKDHTKVINELRTEEHTGIDNSRDVQYKILDRVAGVLNDHRRFNFLIEQYHSLLQDS